MGRFLFTVIIFLAASFSCRWVYSQPINDECNNAITLTIELGNSCTFNSYSIANATNTLIDCPGVPTWEDIWFSFTAIDDEITFEIGDFDVSIGYLSVYSNSCTNLQVISCQDFFPNTSKTVPGLNINTMYFVKLTFPLPFGNIQMCTHSPPVANDECAGATLTPVETVSCSFNTYKFTNATNSLPNDCPISPAWMDVWFEFLSIDDEITIEVGSSPGTVRMALYSGDCTNLSYHGTCLTFPSNSSGTFTGLSIESTYFLKVDFFPGASGDIDICLHSPENVLPVELLNFNSQKIESNVMLFWQTVNEINNTGFELQKSKDTKIWTAIAWIESQSNSSTLTEYEHLDEQPFLGSNYYRLKQVDFDGSFEYSKIISIDYSPTNNPEIYIYPNPASNIITILSNSYLEFQLKVFDTLGRLIYSNTKLHFQSEIDISAWEKGLYILNFTNGQTKFQHKFLKQ